MVSRLIRNQLPSNGLRVRAPCPPLSEPLRSVRDLTPLGMGSSLSIAAYLCSPPTESDAPSPHERWFAWAARVLKIG